MDYFNHFLKKLYEDELYVCTLPYGENRKVECYGPFSDRDTLFNFEHEFLVPNEELYELNGISSIKKYYPYPLKLHILSRKFNPIVSKTSIISSKN